MTIHIQNLSFETIIGILDFERERAQSVNIDVEINYIYSKNNFLDYAEITALIQANLNENRYGLIEEALLGLKDKISTTYPQVTSLFIKIEKPDILKNCTVAISNRWDF